jgi:hypothetical protein
MDTRRIPPEYLAIEEHIRRARIERAAMLGKVFASIAHASWNGVSRAARAVFGSLSAARNARTIEADVLLNRIVMR